MAFNFLKKIKKIGNSVSEFFEEVNRQVEEDQRIKKEKERAELLFENTKALIDAGGLDLNDKTLLDLTTKYKEFLSHEVLAECFRFLADICISKNEILKAEHYINESMHETGKAFYNSDHLYQAYALDRMALVHLEKGNPNQSESCYFESLRIKEKLLLQPYSGGLSLDGFMVRGGEIKGANRDIDKAEIAKTAANLAVLLFNRSNHKAYFLIARSLELFEELSEYQHRFNDSGANCFYQEPSDDIVIILSELSNLYDQNKELLTAAKVYDKKASENDGTSVGENNSYFSAYENKVNASVDDSLRWYHDETFYSNVSSFEESTKAESKRELNIEKGLPEWSHFPWSVFEKEKLINQFQSGADLLELSNFF